MDDRAAGILWANRVIADCIAECDGDVDAALAAADYIVSTQPMPATGIALDDSAPALPVAGISDAKPVVVDHNSLYVWGGTQHKRESEWTDDNYPRNNSRQFLDKYAIAAAARSPEALLLLRDSIPDTERWKLDKAVASVMVGGTVNHPRERPELGVDLHGRIPDLDWAAYQRQTDEYAQWIARAADRDDRTKLADQAIRIARADNPDWDEVDFLLKEAGAKPAELRKLSRAAHGRSKVGNYVSEDALHEVYEDMIEAVYARIEREAEDDAEPPKPEEPTGAHLSHENEHALPGNDKAERVELIARILAILFDERGIEVAKQLYAAEHPEVKQKTQSQQPPTPPMSAPMAMDEQGIWHGPTPPATQGWVQIQPGPLGGLRWVQTGTPHAQSAVPNPLPHSPLAPPPPPAGTGQHAAAHRQRAVNAIAAYNHAIGTIQAGHTLSQEHKTSLARHLSVMTKAQLRSLYSALGGTAAVAGSNGQRQPWVHAIRAILTGQPAPSRAPTPTPTHQTTQLPIPSPPGTPEGARPSPTPSPSSPPVTQRPGQAPPATPRTPPPVPSPAPARQELGIVDKIHSVLKSNPTTEQMALMIDKIRGLTPQEAQELQNRLKPQVPHTSKPPEHPTGIRVYYNTYSSESKQRAEVKRMFGRDLTDGEIGAMACAPSGAVVSVTADDNEVQLNVNHEQMTTTRTITKHRNGTLSCHNDYFRIAYESPHKSKGAELLLNQVRQLKALGVKYIDTLAAGDASGLRHNEREVQRWEDGGRRGPKPSVFNGFYTWPRLGYSATMSARQFQALPEEIRTKMGDSREMRDLMNLPGGPKAWKENGSSLDCKFDLTDGSINLKAMDDYFNERAKKPPRQAARRSPAVNQ